ASGRSRPCLVSHRPTVDREGACRAAPWAGLPTGARSQRMEDWHVVADRCLTSRHDPPLDYRHVWRADHRGFIGPHAWPWGSRTCECPRNLTTTRTSLSDLSAYCRVCGNWLLHDH